jgi:hypothetical protein
MITFVRAVWAGPICARLCEHESCLVIACPSLFRLPVRHAPGTPSLREVPDWQEGSELGG